MRLQRACICNFLIWPNANMYLQVADSLNYDETKCLVVDVSTKNEAYDV